MPPLDASLSIAMAALASIISNALRDSRLPRWANITIALAAFVLCTMFTYWVTRGFNGDLRSNVLPLIALGVGLAGKELFDLLNYVKGASSPLTLAMRRRVPPYVQRGNTTRPTSLTVPMHDEQVL